MDHGCERALCNLDDGIKDDKGTNKKERSLIYNKEWDDAWIMDANVHYGILKMELRMTKLPTRRKEV